MSNLVSKSSYSNLEYGLLELSNNINYIADDIININGQMTDFNKEVKQLQENVKTLEEEIRDFEPDVIHSQHIWIISGLLNDYKIPYIITSHGAEFITYNRTSRFDNYGINAVEGAKNIIAISKDNIKEIIDKFPTAENKIEFIKNGYNSNEFFIEDINKKEVLERLSINKEYDKIVLFVGRISKMKGLDVLLNAAKIYENDKILTLIVGDGEFRQELDIMKKELDLKNVIFLGSKEHSQLRELYNISDVLVLPSRKEALPLVAIEALACGTPAVVTNQSGMSDIINKDVGLTFELDNEKMLAEKINLILHKQIKFDKSIISNYAKENYSDELLINRLLEVYESIKL